MTVLYTAEPTTCRGDFRDRCLAQNRPDRVELRRSQPGGRCRSAAPGHARDAPSSSLVLLWFFFGVETLDRVTRFLMRQLRGVRHSRSPV